jgi:hypothetical protein
MPDDVKEGLNQGGLGLGDFVAGTPQVDKPPEKASPVKVDPVVVKPDIKTAPIDAKTAKVDDKTAVKADIKADAKPEVESKVEPDFKPNWDDDSNPWKKKAGEFDQRFRDTQRSRSEQETQMRQLHQQIAVLGKKLDGTYDPQRDEPPAPDPRVEHQRGQIVGKAEASLTAAFRSHGEETVMKSLERYAEIFGNDRFVQQRILESPDPVQGAMDAVKGFDFFTKYGNDQNTIIEKIRTELETELTPKIAEREAKRIVDELAQKRSEPKGLGKVQGSSGATDKQISKDNASRPRDLANIFGH